MQVGFVTPADLIVKQSMCSVIHNPPYFRQLKSYFPMKIYCFSATHLCFPFHFLCISLNIYILKRIGLLQCNLLQGFKWYNEQLNNK